MSRAWKALLPAVPYLVDLPADLPNSPHQELLQVATLGAWPSILPNQAPGGEGWNRHGWWERGLAAGAKRSHEKGIGLDQGKQTWRELGKAEFSIAVTEAQALGLLYQLPHGQDM